MRSVFYTVSRCPCPRGSKLSLMTLEECMFRRSEEPLYCIASIYSVYPEISSSCALGLTFVIDVIIFLLTRGRYVV